MNLAEQVGQMLMGGFEGLTAPDYFLEWLQEGRLGGVILFARNVDTPQQVADLAQELHAAAKYPLLIAIDQEGGTVSRLRAGFTESPSAAALANIPEDAEGWTERVAAVLAAEMHALGINWNYAPVMDLNYDAENPTLGTRSFGLNPEVVARLASAAVRGFQQNGVAACAKHFPGLGETKVDTHLDLPRLDTSLEHLLAHDIWPYRVAIENGLAAIMTTHTIFNALDTQYPATLSETLIQGLLRKELGFEGVVTTDCLEMKAIDQYFGITEAVIWAARAGLDLLLISHTAEKQAQGFESLLAAVERDQVPLEHIHRANDRIAAFKARFPANTKPNVSHIFTPQHQALTLAAARASIAVFRAETGMLPLTTGILFFEFEFGINSYVEEQKTETLLEQILKRHLPELQTAQNLEAALTQPAERLLIATRNAHLDPQQMAAIRRLEQRGLPIILLALRNPHDKDLIHAGTVLCSFGDSRPALEAASLILAGKLS